MTKAHVRRRAETTVRILPLLLGLFLAAGGCTADLQRVHVPDLLRVDIEAAQRHRGRDPAEYLDEGSVPLPIHRLHATLQERQRMNDGDPATAALAPDPAAMDQFILVDLGTIQNVSRVRQLHAPPGGYPRRYRIDAAGDHNFPYELTYVGVGEPGDSTARFQKPVCCRFLRITLLDTSSTPWNVAELLVE